MHDLYEHLAAASEETREVKNAGRALVSARSRCERRFGDFVRKASTSEEREDRLQLVASDLLGVVHNACVEHDFDRQDEVQATLSKVLSHLREAAAPMPVDDEQEKDCDWCGGRGRDGEGECKPCKGEGRRRQAADDSKCPECGSTAGLDQVGVECKVCGAPVGDGSKAEKPSDDGENPFKSSTIKAADDASSYQGGTEAPDKDTSLDVDTSNGRPDHIDVGSKRNPSEQQDVTEGDEDALDDDGHDAATNDAVTETVGVDDAIGSEEVGDATQTFDGGESSAVTSKLRIV